MADYEAGSASIQPPLQRCAVVPPPLQLSWKCNLRAAWRREGSPPPVRGWQHIVEYRQRVMFVLAAAMTAVILYLSNLMLVAQQMPAVTRNIYLVVYGLMTFLLATNLFKMVLGSWHMVHSGADNPWHPARTACEPPAGVKVAIVFPIYHEEIERVAAGIAATWESIERTRPGYAHHFDCFLLSDSRQPEYRLVEEAAVHHLREAFPNGRFFYRWRPSNANAKLGNIGDFCRRWGGGYDHMLVMDADSVMDGEAIVDLLRMMSGNSRIGILQTNPRPILRESLFGRMQQFAARLYGSVFSWGLQAMYMGNASYIGHNALVRLEPFMRYATLPELTGAKPWGGKPLSHDILESALMARAGYEVWFINDIVGSYEEMPANVVAFLARERRWMQGNLQHLRFVFLRGIRSIHRETFVTGSLGYCSAPLWAAFLVISAYGMLHFLRFGVLEIGSLQAIEMPMLMLFISSIIFLFMPRMLAVAVHIAQHRARLFGGKDKLVWSVLLETCFSFFFSPMVMIFFTRFLWMWAKRKGIDWGTQPRGDEPLPWETCVKNFTWVSVIGAVCAVTMVWQIASVPWTQEVLLSTMSRGLLEPADLLIGFAPILVGFTISIWIAHATSKTWPVVSRLRLFTIPEEVEAPPVVQAVLRWEASFRKLLPNVADREQAIARVLGDPWFYERHIGSTRQRSGVAAILLPQIQLGQRLTSPQLLRAVTDIDCFTALHLRSRARITS
jgi:membrane glycosyltransferase